MVKHHFRKVELAVRFCFSAFLKICENSSAVECFLPKEEVAGSNPVSHSSVIIVTALFLTNNHSL